MKKKSQLPLRLQFFADKGDDLQPNDAEQAQQAKPDTKTIPYDRFKQVNDDLKLFRETFEELGLDGVDSLKALVSDYQGKKQQEEQRKREEMSEIERLKADLQSKQEAEMALQQKLNEFKTQVEREKIHNAFITKAQAANIAYIDDALALADLSSVTVDEEGVKGVDEVIAMIVESKPFLITQQTPKQPKEIGQPSNNGNTETVKTLEAQLEEAKKSRNFSKVIEISNQINKALN